MVRTVVLLAVAIGSLAWSRQTPSRAEPFVPVGVWYSGGDTARRELRTIKSLGFNSVWIPIAWRTAEPQRGTYRLDSADQLLALADDVGLRAVLQLHTDAMPPWLGAAYPDAALVNDEGVAADPAAAGVCLDHDGVRSALAAFTNAVVGRASRHQTLYAVDVWSDPHNVEPSSGAAGEYCFCPHTQGRFRQWLKSRYVLLDSLDAAWGRRHASWNDVVAPRRSEAATGAAHADWRTFTVTKLRDDLAFKANAARAGGRYRVTGHSGVPSILTSPASRFGSPDDWLMSGAVDHYGTSLHPKPGATAAMTPTQVALSLDGIRSAAGDRGWWMARLQADPPATAADLRSWGWTAVAQGARAIAFDSWSSLQTGGRAQAAGEFAGIITRNPALFAPLRPRASRVGILYDPETADLTRTSIAEFHRALFEQNFQADFVHSGMAAGDVLSRYDALFVPGGFPISDAAAAALKRYVALGGALVAGGRVKLPVPGPRYGKGRTVRLAGGAPPPRIAELTGVQPDVRIGDGSGHVEARFLESRDAIVLVALNHADEPRRATLIFPPGTKQEFWQNMETGEMVTFAPGAAGITLSHTFAPRDALVLTIRKTSPYDR